MVTAMFSENQVQAWNRLPIREAMNRVRIAAGLIDASSDVAEKEYTKIRESFEKENLLNVANRAAGNLNGVVLAVPTAQLDLLTPLLQAGGRVTVTLREGKPVIQTQAPNAAEVPVSSDEPNRRTRYDVFHKGKLVDEPLTKFLRREYPDSRASKILDKFRGKKTKVGPWEAIQRDKATRDHFSRKPKAGQ